MDTDAGSSLLLLGEFHRVAEDLDSLLLRTGSSCLGKLTVEAEHLPAPERTQHTTTVHMGAGGPPRSGSHSCQQAPQLRSHSDFREGGGGGCEESLEG